MIIRAILLAVAAEVLSAEELSSDWERIPATPIGHAYDVEVKGDYLYVNTDAGWKVRSADHDSWLLLAQDSDCEFYGRFGACGNFYLESELDSIRFIDLKNDARQSRISGFASAIHEGKVMLGDTSLSVERNRAGLSVAINASESGRMIMAIPYEQIGSWVFLTTVDTVLRGSATGKRWQFSGLVRWSSEKGLFPDSLMTGPRFVNDLRIVNEVVYANDSRSRWRSEDFGRTWSRVDCLPWGEDLGGGGDTIIGRCHPPGLTNAALGISVDNGRTWISRGKSILWPTETRYRDGAIWRYTVDAGRVVIEKSSDLGESWSIVRDESRNWIRLRGWGVGRSGGLYAVGGDYKLYKLNSETSDWVEFDKYHFPGMIRKARAISSGIYILQRGWIGSYPGLIEPYGGEFAFEDNALLRFHQGQWEVVGTNIRDFEAVDGQVFVVGAPRQISGPASPKKGEAFRKCEGPQLWEFAVQRLTQGDQRVTGHEERVIAECQYSDRGLSVNYVETYGFLWASRDGCIQFASGAGYPSYGRRTDLGPFIQSCNSGLSWGFGMDRFEPLQLIDTGRVRVDSMLNIYVKKDRSNSVQNRKHQSSHLLMKGQKLVLELNVNSDVQIEVVSPNGKPIDVIQKSNMNPGVHQITIPQSREVLYARVTVDGQVNVVALAPTQWGR